MEARNDASKQQVENNREFQQAGVKLSQENALIRENLPKIDDTASVNSLPDLQITMDKQPKSGAHKSDFSNENHIEGKQAKEGKEAKHTACDDKYKEAKEGKNGQEGKEGRHHGDNRHSKDVKERAEGEVRPRTEKAEGQSAQELLDREPVADKVNQPPNPGRIERNPHPDGEHGSTPGTDGRLEKNPYPDGVEKSLPRTDGRLEKNPYPDGVEKSPPRTDGRLEKSPYPDGVSRSPFPTDNSQSENTHLHGDTLARTKQYAPEGAVLEPNFSFTDATGKLTTSDMNTRRPTPESVYQNAAAELITNGVDSLRDDPEAQAELVSLLTKALEMKQTDESIQESIDSINQMLKDKGSDLSIATKKGEYDSYVVGDGWGRRGELHVGYNYEILLLDSNKQVSYSMDVFNLIGRQL